MKDKKYNKEKKQRDTQTKRQIKTKKSLEEWIERDIRGGGGRKQQGRHQRQKDKQTKR